LLRIANRLGYYHIAAEGYFILCSRQHLEKRRLLKKITVHLNQTKKYHHSGSYAVHRIDFRLRGALILFIYEEKSNQTFILRVVSDAKTDKIVRRNQEFLHNLRSLPNLTEQIVKLIPEPLGEFVHDDSTVFIETMVPGILAWKVNRGKLKKHIYKQTTDFIEILNILTKSKFQLDDKRLNQLFDQDLKRINILTEITPHLKKQFEKVVLEIKRVLKGQEIFLSYSHGDFGYGNILVNPRSGRLTGVIDWDTGRKFELVGIDFINLEIQKNRIENHNEFFTAFSKTSNSIISRKSLDRNGRYQSEFGIKDYMLNLLLAVSLVRYMSRSAQYPEVFSAEQNNYKRAIDFLQNEILKHE